MRIHLSCAHYFTLFHKNRQVCAARRSVTLTLWCGVFACVRQKQKMCENMEQWICIDFCFKLSKTGTGTYEMIKTTFGDEVMSCSQVFEWFWRFKEGCQSMNSDPRSGRPSTSRNEEKIALETLMGQMCCCQWSIFRRRLTQNLFMYACFCIIYSVSILSE